MVVLVLILEKEVLEVVNDGLVFVLLLLAVLIVPGVAFLALVIALIRWLNRH